MRDRLHECELVHEGRERQEVGGLGQEHVVLEEYGHADRADERRKSLRLAERLVCDLLDGESVRGGVDDRDKPGEDEERRSGQTQQRERARRDERGECADHVDLAVGKVDQLDDPVDHGVAEGDQRVDAAPGEPAEE